MSSQNIQPATRSRWLDWKPSGRILAKIAGRAPSKPSKLRSEGFEGISSAQSPNIDGGEDTTELARTSAWLCGMNSRPEAQIFVDPPDNEPAKPSKAGFVGFEDSLSTQSLNIAAAHDPAESIRAVGVLNSSGVRRLELKEGAAIGIWSDLDGPEIRAALATLGIEHMAIRYLDGRGVPMRYKLRKVAGEAVPLSVLNAMEEAQSEPWRIRDIMLERMRQKR